MVAASLGVVRRMAACGGAERDSGRASEPAAETQAEEELVERARTITHEGLLVDTHIDTPYRFERGDEDLSQRTAKGDFDHPRAVAGGLDAAFMSIYVPADYQDGTGTSDRAFAYANQLIDRVEGWAQKWPEHFAIATGPEQVREIAGREGVVALSLGIENGAPVRDLADLEHFRDRGIRYVTLTHGENNHIGDSSYGRGPALERTLTLRAGARREMNRLGVHGRRFPRLRRDALRRARSVRPCRCSRRTRRAAPSPPAGSGISPTRASVRSPRAAASSRSTSVPPSCAKTRRSRATPSGAA